jgi:hypothetical protein
MPDPTLDRVAAILRSGGRIAMTTADLARALGPGDPTPTAARLERLLPEDDRFILLDAGATLPGLAAWAARDRAAYAAALRHVDLPRPPLVLLRDVVDLSGRRVGTPAATALTALLHHTVLDLATTRFAAAVAGAAEATRAALVRVTPPPERSARSTSLPPGPPRPV